MSPLALEKRKLAKSLERKRTCYSRKNKELYKGKAETGVKGGVLALKTETLLQKRKK